MLRYSSRSKESKKQTTNKKLVENDQTNDNGTNDNTLVPSTTILPGDQSNERILSPHNSILQALNNPDLELSINSNNNTNQNFYINNEFSITSWQSISCFQDLNTHNRLNNSNNKDSNNSNKNIIALSKSSSYDSPYIGSVLSSSDNEEREKEKEKEREENDLSHTHQVLMFNSDSDTENELTEDDEYDQLTNTDSDFNNGKTGNSIPSFVMPRISISNSQTNELLLNNNNNNSYLSVQVIGHQKELLINRLNEYKKSLKNIRFTNKNPQLIILIVNSDNYVLPNLLHKPFIPIFIEELPNLSSSAASSSESNAIANPSENDLISRLLFNSTMICKPILLKNFNDDLMDLIEFLSNLNSNSFKSIINDINDKLIESTTLDKKNNSLSLSQANSLFIKKDVNLRRKSTGTIDEEQELIDNNNIRRNSLSVSHYYDHMTENSKTIKLKNSNNTIRYNDEKKTGKGNNSNNNNNNNELKAKLIYGITIGVVSLTMIYIWKEVIFSSTNNKADTISISKIRLSDHIVKSSADSLNSNHPSTYTNPINESVITPIIESILNEIDDFRKFTMSTGFDLFNRFKFTLRDILDFTSEIITGWVS